MTKVVIDGRGAKADGKVVNITVGGVYSLSRALGNGQMEIRVQVHFEAGLEGRTVNLYITATEDTLYTDLRQMNREGGAL